MKITISKPQWQFIGRKTGWFKLAKNNPPKTVNYSPDMLNFSKEILRLLKKLKSKLLILRQNKEKPLDNTSTTLLSRTVNGDNYGTIYVKVNLNVISNENPENNALTTINKNNIKIHSFNINENTIINALIYIFNTFKPINP